MKKQTLAPSSGQELHILIIFIFLCWPLKINAGDLIVYVAVTECIDTTQIPTNLTALKHNVLLLAHLSENIEVSITFNF